MPCPICDQKPMNCDCTETERRQYAEIEELEEQVARLRLTDEERTAILTVAIVYLKEDEDFPGIAEDKATLLALLERTK